MRRLGREMRDLAMVEQGRVDAQQRRGRRGRGEAVEQDRDAREARRDDGPRDRRELEAAEPAQQLEPVAGAAPACSAAPAATASRLRARRSPPTPVPGPVQSAASPPNRARHSAEAAVVFAIPISPSATRSMPCSTAIIP